MLEEGKQIERCNTFLDSYDSFDLALKAKLSPTDEAKELLLTKLMETEFDFFSIKAKTDQKWIKFLNRS